MNDNNLAAPGYRFYPTEEELLSYYLRNKLGSIREAHMQQVIPVVDIYRWDPWQLPAVSAREAFFEHSEQWFFFCPQQQREATGGRPTRMTPSGYWKATGSPYVVYSANRPIGVKKTMVFYQGKAPEGKKTKWKMNEYRAIVEDNEPLLVPGAIPKLRNEFSVCRVYKNLGCLRPFDRRPVTGTSSSNHTAAAAEASSNEQQNNITGAKRTRSQEDGLSAEDDSSHHEVLPEGAMNSEMLDQGLDWDTWDWL